MVAINPIIFAGGRNAAPAVTAGGIMPSTYRYPTFLFEYNTLVQAPAPFFYILRPGAAAPQHPDFDVSQLLARGLPKSALKRVFMAGHMLLSGLFCLNFICSYNSEEDADNMHGFCCLMDEQRACSLPVIAGNQDMAGVSLAPLYALYCDNMYIGLNDFRNKDWREYSTVSSLTVYYEQY